MVGSSGLSRFAEPFEASETALVRLIVLCFKLLRFKKLGSDSQAPFLP